MGVVLTAESLVRAEMVVEGDVQGVGFRYFVRRAARRLGVKGFVENLETGAVKVVAEASKERVEKLVERIKSAPPPIAVDEITVTYGKPTGEFKTFKIVVKDLAEEMVEGFATGASYFEIMFEKQDKALVKLDTLIEKQDLMLAKQDQMLQKQDLMLEKQDQMLGKMDLMLEKQDQMLQKQGQMLQKQDEMVERQDVLVDEVKGLRRDVSSLMEDRIARIERDVAMIKARLGITG